MGWTVAAMVLGAGIGIVTGWHFHEWQWWAITTPLMCGLLAVRWCVETR